MAATFPGSEIRIPKPGDWVEYSWWSHVAGVQVAKYEVQQVRSKRNKTLDLLTPSGVLLHGVPHAHTFQNVNVWCAPRSQKEWRAFRRGQARRRREDWERWTSSDEYKREQAEFESFWQQSGLRELLAEQESP